MRSQLILTVLSMAIRTGTVLVITIASSRLLGVTGFADFSYALVVATLVVLIVDFGFETKLTRDAAIGGHSGPELVVATTLAKAALVLPAVVLLVALTALNALDRRLMDTIALTVVGQLSYSFARHLLVPWRVRGDYRAEFYLTIVMESVTLVTFLAMAAVYESPLAAAGGFAVGRAIGLIVTLGTSNQWFRVALKDLHVRRQIAEAIPYAVHAATAVLYVNIDVLILKKLVSTFDLGIYQAGIRAVLAACLLTIVAQNVFLPRLAAALPNPEVFNRLKNRFLILTLLTGSAVSIGVIIFSEPLVTLVLGAEFRPLVPMMAGFAVVIMLRYTGTTYGAFLTVVPRGQGVRAVVAVLSVLLVVVGNFIMVPRYGIPGALWVMIFVHVFLNVAYVAYWHVTGARATEPHSVRVDMK